MEIPVSHALLEDAVACELIDLDGTRWRVLDVTFRDDRAWVHARPVGNGSRESHGTSHPREGPSATATPGVVERVVSQGIVVVWSLPDGRRVVAEGQERGVLRWELQEAAPSAEDALERIQG